MYDTNSLPPSKYYIFVVDVLMQILFMQYTIHYAYIAPCRHFSLTHIGNDAHVLQSVHFHAKNLVVNGVPVHKRNELQSFFYFLIVCFTSYYVLSIAVLPHSPGVVYYHLLLRRETRIPGVALFSFQIGIWDLFVHRGQKSYTPTAFGKLWTTPGVRCMKHASS